MKKEMLKNKYISFIFLLKSQKSLEKRAKCSKKSLEKREICLKKSLAKRESVIE